MINRILAGIIDQQAPSLCWHSAPVDTQRLSINAQRISGGTTDPQKIYRNDGQKGVKPAIKKIGSHPSDNSHLVTGGFMTSLLLIVIRLFHAAVYLSTRAIFLLYQFINADVERLKKRYTIMIMATPSIACPV